MYAILRHLVYNIVDVLTDGTVECNPVCDSTNGYCIAEGDPVTNVCTCNDGYTKASDSTACEGMYVGNALSHLVLNVSQSYLVMHNVSVHKNVMMTEVPIN